MMSAHMDTVVPGEGVKPIVEGDIIRTDGTTVLGGDDKSGCVVIIEVIRACRSRKFRTRRSKRSFPSARK
jgi:tripeptide aminopeptidase